MASDLVLFPPNAVAVTPDATAPTVTNVTPADGAEISKTQTVTFDVTDSGGNLLRANIHVYYPSLGLFEVVWYGQITGSWGTRRAGFAPKYTGNRTSITNGYRYADVIRVGGWPARPVIVVGAVDDAGNEA